MKGFCTIEGQYRILPDGFGTYTVQTPLSFTPAYGVSREIVDAILEDIDVEQCGFSESARSRKIEESREDDKWPRRYNVNGIRRRYYDKDILKEARRCIFVDTLPVYEIGSYIEPEKEAGHFERIAFREGKRRYLNKHRVKDGDSYW